MIEMEAAMTVRENVHQLVDTLPEDRLGDVLDYLADLSDTEETLSVATEAAIEEGSTTSRMAARSRWKNTGGHAVCEVRD